MYKGVWKSYKQQFQPTRQCCQTSAWLARCCTSSAWTQITVLEAACKCCAGRLGDLSDDSGGIWGKMWQDLEGSKRSGAICKMKEVRRGRGWGMQWLFDLLRWLCYVDLSAYTQDSHTQHEGRSALRDRMFLVMGLISKVSTYTIVIPPWGFKFWPPWVDLSPHESAPLAGVSLYLRDVRCKDGVCVDLGNESRNPQYLISECGSAFAHHVNILYVYWWSMWLVVCSPTIITSSPTCRCCHPLPCHPLPCPSLIPSPCQASCSSSIPKILRSPTTLTSTNNACFALSPCFLVIFKSCFPYLSFLSFNHSFRFPFPPCPMVQAKHHQCLDLVPAVTPLDILLITPQ